MSNQENEPRRNFWTTGGMSFRTRLFMGLGLLLVLVLIWVAQSGDAPGAVYILLPFMIITYFIPVMVAGGRKHKALGAIFALNLFLGWSLLGWVAALVWALTNPKPDAPVVVNAAPGSTADELAKLADLKEKGILTEEEFQARKKALLS